MKTINQELIHKYLKGDALAQEKLEVLHWIEASPENMGQYMKYRRLYDAAIWNETKGASVRPEAAPNKPSFTIRLVRELSKVAAVIVVAVSVTLFFQRSNEKQLQGLAQIIEVPQGQHVNLTLSDGTKVSLNSNSKLRFPSSFEANNRTVVLDGEGFFEVAHNTKRPFHVQTQKCDVKVLGTVFNVLAYNNSTVFETSLKKGSVQITDLKSSTQVLLKPNEKAVLEDGKLIQSAIDPDAEFLWKQGIYLFKNETLGAIFQKLESYYHTKIIIQNKEVGKLKCTGKFRQLESVDHIINVLQKANDFKYKQDYKNNAIVIL